MDNFYQKCENKCPTILFFKTAKGERFGGYTSKIWENNGEKKDEDSFIFSLDRKEKYKSISKNPCIIGRKGYFQFGACFRIYDNCTTNSNNYIKEGNRIYDLPSGYGLTLGENKFIISNFEVYQIEL